MNRRKSLFKFIFVAFCLAALTSCYLFEPLSPYLGRLLKVDEQGHFTEEIIYREGSFTYILKPDGTYEAMSESFEDEGEEADGDGVTGEGWVPVSGYGGTYSWDAETFIMQWTTDFEIVQGDWAALSGEPTYYRGYYFTEHAYGIAWLYTGDFNACRDEFTRVYSDGTSWMQSSSMEWGEDSSTTVTFRETNADKDPEGNVVSGTELTRSGSFVLYPDGVKMKKGNAFTIRATITETIYEDDTWSGDQYIYSMDFFHAGEFLVEWLDPTAQRGLLTP